jgi:hypothetical protein
MSTEFNFPANPVLGDTVTLPDGGQAQWNGYAWITLGSGSSVDYPITIDKGGTSATTLSEAQLNLIIGLTNIDTAEPATPKYGDRWIRPDNMTEQVWVPNADGSSGVWINPAGGGGGGGGIPDAPVDGILYGRKDLDWIPVLDPLDLPITITQGGTGAEDASTALTNLGGSAIGTNLFKVASPLDARSIIHTYDLGITASTRNFVDNGDMWITQRSGPESVLGIISFTTQGSFMADRWTLGTVGGFVTGRRSVDDVNRGFMRYLELSITTAGTPAADDYANVSQRLLGRSLVDLHWGFPDASPAVLSFDLQCSVNGTYAAAIRRFDGGSSYVIPINYTADGNVQHFSFIIPGPTTGGTAAWPNGGTHGGTISLSCAAGSSNLTTPFDWQTGAFFGPTGMSQLTTTLGATFRISNVQFEKGVVETPYERLHSAQQLANCKYFFETLGVGVANEMLATAWLRSASTVYALLQYTTKRTIPTITLGPLTNLQFLGSNGGVDITANVAGTVITTQMAQLNLTLATAQPTTVSGGWIQCKIGLPSYIYISADL